MKIVMAFDGSEPSTRALQEALRLARAAHATLTVVIVIEEPPVSVFGQLAGLSPEYFRAQLEESAAQADVAARQLATQSGLDVGIHTRRGRPVDEILDAARDADMIIVGTHGHRGMDRVLLGSVAETLVRRSSIPVLVVPPRPVVDG